MPERAHCPVSVTKTPWQLWLNPRQDVGRRHIAAVELVVGVVTLNEDGTVKREASEQT